MYLISILLPGLSSLSTGLFGRKIGTSGAAMVSTILIFTCLIFSLMINYEVVLCQSPMHLFLVPWMTSDTLDVGFAFHFDQVTTIIIMVVSIISSLVHLYSVWYMAHDPHLQRFLSYLSAFTFFMMILVAADSYLLMFVGWEGIGVLSFLLINFWTTRIQASKAAIQAITVNRIGDMFLSIGFFVSLWAFTNVDYVTSFSLAAYMNESTLTIIGLLFLIGASAKSAQIGLHTWLVNAMEGYSKLKFILMICLVYFIYTFSASGTEIGLTFDTVYMSSLPLIFKEVDRKVLETMTGNILGDGSLRSGYSDGRFNPKARYSLTIKASSYDYIMYLKNNIYSPFHCSHLGPYPNPDLPHHKGSATLSFWDP